MNRIRSLLPAIAAVMSVALVSGCGSGGDTLTPAANGNGSAPQPERGAVAQATEAVLDTVATQSFTSLRQLAQASELVVIGTVRDVTRLPGSTDSESGTTTTMRALTIDVEEILVGTRPAEPVVLRDFGWVTDPGQPDLPLRASSAVRLESGDRALLFLSRSSAEASQYNITDGAGIYRVLGEEIEDDGREHPSPLARQVQKMTLAEAKSQARGR
jgi:hypothetical protein